MKLTIIRAGGIAGIVARTELDQQALPKSAAKDFAGEVSRARLSDQPPPPPDVPRPDTQLYELNLEWTGREVTARYTDDSLPEDVRLLVAWVDSRPERVESIEL
ncbi:MULTISPECIES: protealysin inhibitor emfourin [Arthrobacter]|uniref:Uncharacterized protein n=1 Tax=Arthrobacter psychrochitiniphilus TaxID=291045 RepID=A0A2V3DY20_9MICC|nr:MULTISPECIES: protealysin inhibitor emfourin [Arthrobacter]NYG16441.1 hypothetical protein [Arthrobacter psychrochitiniphilus]PXA69410.1 hypothetical protein CVS29_02345 [Arthrobacter psychrochitiniphilus]